MNEQELDRQGLVDVPDEVTLGGMKTPLKCSKCFRTRFEDRTELLRCGGENLGCDTTLYCSRRCQDADWDEHKLKCWPKSTMPAHLLPHNTHRNIKFERGKALVLIGRDEEAVYKLLIEACRVWDEQLAVTRGNIPDPRLLRRKDLVGYSFKYLMEFIRQAETKNVLPGWWDAQSRAACEKVARELWHWSDIDTDAGREVNQKNRYGGQELHESLRMLAMLIHGGWGAALRDEYFRRNRDTGYLMIGPA